MKRWTILLAVAVASLSTGPAATAKKRVKGLSHLQAITASRAKTMIYVKRHYGISLRIPDISSTCARTSGSGTPWKCSVSAKAGAQCAGSLVVFGTPPDHVKARNIRITCSK